jgi:hypothetical protein
LASSSGPRWSRAPIHSGRSDDHERITSHPTEYRAPSPTDSRQHRKKARLLAGLCDLHSIRCAGHSWVPATRRSCVGMHDQLTLRVNGTVRWWPSIQVGPLRDSRGIPTRRLRTCVLVSHEPGLGFPVRSGLAPRLLGPADDEPPNWEPEGWRGCSYLDPDCTSPLWRRARAMSVGQREAIAPMLLAALLRRAASAGRFATIQEALRVALATGLAEDPAPQQSAALLRRSTIVATECKTHPGRSQQPNGSPAPVEPSRQLAPATARGCPSSRRSLMAVPPAPSVAVGSVLGA